MSALCLAVAKDSCVIAVDTLAVPDVSGGDGPTHWHTSKMVLVQHLGAAIVGLGFGPLFKAWCQIVQSLCLVPPTVTALDAYAPAVLVGLAKKVGLERSAMPRAQIYHFGFDPVLGTMRVFGYRSANDFESEVMSTTLEATGAPVFGLIPLKGVEGLFNAEMPEVLAGRRPLTEAFVTLISAQKAVHDAKPPADRPVHIGGEIHCLRMRQGQYALDVIHRFPDSPA